MKNYSALAKYYDRFSQNDCDYESWSQYLCAVARQNNVKTVVDVACGTGKMTALLSKQGFAVTGVDVSAEMLAEASQKCRANFVLQDMKKLRLTRPADMAVVVNDGVNYLKPDELPAFFANLAQNLRENAPLVFDVSSPYKLRRVLSDNVFFVDDDDATLLWTNSQQADSVKLSLAIFRREGAETYRRMDECHTQYVHSSESLTAALASAGFVVEEISSDYGKTLVPDALRITFLCRKVG